MTEGVDAMWTDAEGSSLFQYFASLTFSSIFYENQVSPTSLQLYDASDNICAPVANRKLTWKKSSVNIHTVYFGECSTIVITYLHLNWIS